MAGSSPNRKSFLKVKLINRGALYANSPRVKNCAQIPARAQNIALLYNACTRDISPIICALIRRITGASAWANYRVRTRITLYARIRAPTAYAAYTPRSQEYSLWPAGYASTDNITSSRGVKHMQGPSFLWRLLA